MFASLSSWRFGIGAALLALMAFASPVFLQTKPAAGGTVVYENKQSGFATNYPDSMKCVVAVHNGQLFGVIGMSEPAGFQQTSKDLDQMIDSWKWTKSQGADK
jgi:hypothetical protein